jgi:hypothetical protein
MTFFDGPKIGKERAVDGHGYAPLLWFFFWDIFCVINRSSFTPPSMFSDAIVTRFSGSIMCTLHMVNFGHLDGSV